MYFLIESGNCCGSIVAHGTSLDALSEPFREEAYRLLSGTCVEAYADGTRISFDSSPMHEKVIQLDELLLGGTKLFWFRSSGFSYTEIVLHIQEYSL